MVIRQWESGNYGVDLTQVEQGFAAGQHVVTFWHDNHYLDEWQPMMLTEALDRLDSYFKMVHRQEGTLYKRIK
jgi:hypothetical protein